MKVDYDTLEQLVQKVVGKKINVFRKDGKFTKAGERAYDRLLDILYMSARLTNTDPEIVDNMDNRFQEILRFEW